VLRLNFHELIKSNHRRSCPVLIRKQCTLTVGLQNFAHKFSAVRKIFLKTTKFIDTSLITSVVVKDLRLEDKDKDKDLMSKDEDKDEESSFKDKDKDLGRH